MEDDCVSTFDELLHSEGVVVTHIPAEISSHIGEVDHNDDGQYIGSGYTCNECDETIEPGYPVIIVNDFILDLECAKEFVKEIQAEIDKYK